jgi:hypothetical protein
MHETYGLLAYLEALRSGKGCGHIIAALNLDSPSSKSAEGKPLSIHTDPPSLPSFGAWLYGRAYDAASATAPGEVTSWGWTLAPWSQCDQIMDDPMIGATTPWPLVDNAYHHTSLDRPGTSSDHLTRLVGVSAAAYLYALACAGPEEAIAWAQELASEMSQVKPHVHPFQAEYRRARLLSLSRLGSSEQALLTEGLEGIHHEHFSTTRPSVDRNAFADETTIQEKAEAEVMVPTRKHIFVWDHENIFPGDLQALRSTGVRKEAVLWADGKRNLWEIYQRERAEGQMWTLTELIRYFRSLANIGYLKLKA